MRKNAARAGECVLLAGMMGAGKTTVGRLLAARLGREFLDTDACVERVRGCSVAEIFAREGEAAFRAAESAALAALPDAAVVALGGGALLAPGNRALVRERGTLVWLHAEPQTLLERIAADGSRPLLAGLSAAQRLERLRALAAEREAAYASAELRVATDGRSSEEVCAAVLEGLAALAAPAAAACGGAAR